MRRNLITCLLLAFLLTGCGSSEPEEVPPSVETPPLRQISQGVTWNALSITPITPVCAMESGSDELLIFPYNDNASYISVKKFIFSENNLFGTIVQSCTAENVIETSIYTLCTTENGTTMVYIPYEEDTALLVQSTLPSAYCKRVAEMLCQQLGL